MDLRSPVQAFSLDAGDSSSIERWRQEMTRAFPPLTIQPDKPSEFTASYRAAGTVDLQVSDIRANAHTVERMPGKVTERNLGFYKISYQVSGTGIMTQGNRELTLTPGTIAVYDTARPYDLHFADDYRFIVAMFPKSSLDLPAGLAGELTAYPVDGNSGTGGIVSSYLLSLVDNLDWLAGPTGGRLARTGLDLLSTLVADELDTTAGVQGIERKSMLVEICYYINDHLGDPALSPETIAAAHFVSTRHLHNIFQSAGVTVAQWIKQRRLQECRRDLSDPLMAAIPVATIATKWGLDDPGYFSRIFRESFGASPRQWRQDALLGNVA